MKTSRRSTLAGKSSARNNDLNVSHLNLLESSKNDKSLAKTRELDESRMNDVSQEYQPSERSSISKAKKPAAALNQGPQDGAAQSSDRASLRVVDPSSKR